MLHSLKKLFRPATPTQAIPALPFECLTIHGNEAAAKLQELKEKPGVLPVLLGDRASLEVTLELLESCEESFEDLAAKGLALDVDAWLEQRFGEDPEYYAGNTDSNTNTDGDTETPAGDATPIAGLGVTHDVLTGKPYKQVFIGLIPVASSWLVPAYLKPGNWNDCPPPAVHVALFHRWFERYGASVTTVANDIIEFEVARPPKTYDAALALAREQFTYCPDLVHQGALGLGNLAASLRGSPQWYFWWD